MAGDSSKELKKRYIGIVGKLIFFVIASALFFEVTTRVYFAVKAKKAYYLFYGICSTKSIDDFLHRGKKIDPKEPADTKTTLDAKEYYETSVTMRHRVMPYVKEPGVYRIIAIGGSTTWGDGAKDDETYPYYLEEKFNQRMPSGDIKKVEVLNAGVGGDDISRSLDLIKTSLIKLSPDMVIIFGGWNDIFPVIQKETAEVISNKYLLWFMRHSMFFVAAREKLALALHDHAEYAWVRTDKNKRSESALDLNDPSFARYEAALFEMVRYLKSVGVKPVIVRFPYRFYHDKPGQFEAGMTSYQWKPAVEKAYQIAEKVSNATGAPIIDCETPFNHLDKTKFFGDVMHMTPAGNKVFADVVYGELTKRGLLK